ncbi:unnamed protein product [Mytilus edulis]|uniref:C2H2-type domain-containing protein n=1 Tax=Mytilus edulis TaxID=6550 RepID=A0A8S3QV73_MYTED|nr:unnamed protein product [Mytilus edulis]
MAGLQSAVLIECSDELKKHMDKLNTFCRLCHKVISKPYNKLSFAREILTLFGINVEGEPKEIFPLYFCHTCARHLYRYRSGTDISSLQTLQSIKLKVYLPHSKDCVICFINEPSAKGRPKKRKLKHVNNENQDSIDHECDISENMSQDWGLTDEGEITVNFGNANQTTDVMLLLKHIQHVISSSSKEQHEDFFSKFLDLLPTDSLSVLCECLGRKQKQSISRDADSFFLMYKDMEAMSSFDIFDWLKKRDQSVTAYLLGLAGCDVNALEKNPRDALIVSRAVEHIYYLCSRNFISPVSFLANLTSYAMTGSKVVVDIFGNASPSGHYKTVTNWLKDQGSKPVQLPSNDLMNVFDNEQVVGKTYSIKPSNKVPVSVITNKGFLELNMHSIGKTLQNELSLKPEVKLDLQGHNVMTNKSSSEGKSENDKEVKLRGVINCMIDQVSELYVKMEIDHNEQLYHFIDHAIEVVLAEQQDKDGHFEDPIDLKVRQDIVEENYIKCAACGTLNSKRKQKCTGCDEREGIKKAKLDQKNTKPDPKKKEKIPKLVFIHDEDQSKVSTVTTEFTQYDHITTNHKGKHELVLTDPVYCNPNSIKSVALVLRKIGQENGIHRYGGNKRHWTFVCCDGLPYLIIKKLKEEALVCAITGCHETFLSRDLYEKHCEQIHQGSEKQFMHEFDWMYLRIGAGHYEMNLVKSFFELNWTPFLETLCEIMGFCTDSSKQFAKSCKDHHKSWRLLLIFHLSSLQELVLPYVRNCLSTRCPPTAKGFLTSGIEKYSYGNYQNFKYMLDQVCKFSQGIVNFRMATRRNNADLLKSSKYMTKELFHGRNHPKYQKIELYDTIQDRMMPDNVRELNDLYASITTSGNPSAGEDLDFVLEEKNKQLKAWIPKGMPTDIIWQTVCRNNRALEKIKNHSLSLFGIQSTKYVSRPLGIEDAITAYRTCLRRSNYLDKEKDHTSISGMALDEGLVNFVHEATKKRIVMLRTEFLGEIFEEQSTFKHPLPITPSEREKLQSFGNMTIKQIQKEIHKMLNKIPDPFQFDYHNYIYEQEVETKGKTKLLNFLEELKRVMETLDTEFEDQIRYNFDGYACQHIKSYNIW